ncbi:winged helix-turn-helix domain-containing protein [Colwelliaceae bacterium 6441]
MIVKLEQWFLNALTGTLYLHESDPEKDVIKLDHTPLELLLCLIRHQGKDVTKNTMLNEVWPNKVVSEDVLSVGISQIRKALGDNARNPLFIKTIPGVGYRLIISTVDITPNESQADDKSQSVQVVPTKINPLALYGSIANTLLIIIVAYFSLVKDEHISLADLPSSAAISHYQEARYLLEKHDRKAWLEAKQAFEDTIIKVNNFAPAYRDLVSVKLKLLGDNNGKETYKHKDEFYFLLNKSLSFDPTDAQTHLLMADVAFFVEWNFPLAEKHYKEVVALDPNNSQGHFKYAQFLLAAEKFDLAIKHTRQYVDLEPSAYAVPSVAWIYNMMGDYQSAKKELSHLQKRDPDSLSYHISAQAILENLGEDDASFKELYRVLKLSHYTEEQLAAVSNAFLKNGLSEVNRWLLEEKKEAAYIGQYQPPLSFGRYALKAGKLEAAVKYIKQAFEERNHILLWFNVDPKYKAIRNHPAFKELINPKIT